MGVKYTGKLDLLENDYWGQYKEETCYNLERVALAIDKAIPDSYHGVTYEDRYYFEKTYPQFKAKVIASTKIK
jgi:hypothetical protein